MLLAQVQSGLPSPVTTGAQLAARQGIKGQESLGSWPGHLRPNSRVATHARCMAGARPSCHRG